MDDSCASVLLKNKELGLAFQKSEQKAADHLSQNPAILQTGNSAQSGEVIYPGDLQGASPTPSSCLQTWYCECLDCNAFLFSVGHVLTGKVHHISSQILLIP